MLLPYKIDSAIIVLMLLLNFLDHCNADESYTVPEPQIEILRPRGLKVSIPHEPGIELFAFHGNINKEMNGLEAGYFSKDILKRGDNNGRWIFYDPNAKLKNGDTLYYWLFVINNKLGYRYDNGVFEIKDDNTELQGNNAPGSGGEKGVAEAPTKVPLSCCTTTAATTTDGTLIFPIDIRIGGRRRRASQDSNDEQKSAAFNSCQDLFDNQTATINKLSAEVEKLKEINRLLYDIGEKAAQAGRELRLTVGNKTATNVDPLVEARDVMKKMGLAVDVVKARIGRRGAIVFEVKNVRDKVKIIIAAKEKLRDSDINLTY